MLIIPAAIIIGPWLLRSYILTGNPVWPFLYNVFGGRNWDIVGDKYLNYALQTVSVTDVPITLNGILKSYYLSIFFPQNLGGFVGIGTFVGILFVFGLILIPKSPSWYKDLYFLSISAYIIWFFLGSHQLRFLSPIFPYMCLIAGFCINWILSWLPTKNWQSIGISAITVVLFLQFPFYRNGERDLFLSRWLYIKGETSREIFLGQAIRTMQSIRYINKKLPADSRILLLPFDARGHHLERDYYLGNPFIQRMIRFEQYNNPQDLAYRLKFLGITHILDNPEWMDEGLPTWEHDRRLMLDLEEKCGELINNKNDVKLYLLVPCKS